MKQMNFTGLFATSSTVAAKALASHEARISSTRNARRAEALMLQAELEPVFKAHKRTKRMAPAAAPEEECLLSVDKNVYKTAGHFLKEDAASRRKAFWDSISETIADAVYRFKRETSIKLADAIWGAVKHQMISNSYEDNWEFGELRKALGELSSDLRDGAEKAEPIVRHAYWQVAKMLDHMKNPEVRKLRKELNFSER